MTRLLLITNVQLELQNVSQVTFRMELNVSLVKLNVVLAWKLLVSVVLVPIQMLSSPTSHWEVITQTLVLNASLVTTEIPMSTDASHAHLVPSLVHGTLAK
jgi:hypothetical protein